MDQKKTLVFVEDDLELLKLLKEHFQEAGFSVHGCTNGVEAAELYKMFEPDLLLVDVMLPRLNGLDVLRLIRTNEKKAKTKTKVLVMTGSGDAEVTRLAKELGGLEVIAKPFSFEALEALVREHLGMEVEDQELPFEMVKEKIAQLGSPDPRIFEELPTEFNPAQWQAYRCAEDSETCCFLVPTGVTPRELKSFTEQGIRKQLKVLFKEKTGWFQAWPKEAEKKAA